MAEGLKTQIAEHRNRINRNSNSQSMINDKKQSFQKATY